MSKMGAFRTLNKDITPSLVPAFAGVTASTARASANIATSIFILLLSVVYTSALAGDTQTIELYAHCKNSIDCNKLQVGFISTDFFDWTQFAITNGTPATKTYSYGPKDIKLVFYRQDVQTQIILRPSCVPLVRTPKEGGTFVINIHYGSKKGRFLVTSHWGKHYSEAIPISCDYHHETT